MLIIFGSFDFGDGDFEALKNISLNRAPIGAPISDSWLILCFCNDCSHLVERGKYDRGILRHRRHASVPAETDDSHVSELGRLAYEEIQPVCWVPSVPVRTLAKGHKPPRLAFGTELLHSVPHDAAPRPPGQAPPPDRRNAMPSSRR